MLNSVQPIMPHQTQKIQSDGFLDIANFADERHYFALFGLPLSYTLDHTQLQQNYQELMRQVHPDRFANDQTQQKRAIQIAAYINNAEHTLTHPILRAQYLLQIAGYTDLPHQNSLPADFIEIQIDWRERIETAPHAEALQKLIHDIQEKVEHANHDLAKMFSHWHIEVTPPLTEKIATHIHQSLQKYQFWLKLHEAAETQLETSFETPFF